MRWLRRRVRNAIVQGNRRLLGVVFDPGTYEVQWAAQSTRICSPVFNPACDMISQAILVGQNALKMRRKKARCRYVYRSFHQARRSPPANLSPQVHAGMSRKASQTTAFYWNEPAACLCTSHFSVHRYSQQLRTRAPLTVPMSCLLRPSK
jgi:hypothetical protein